MTWTRAWAAASAAVLLATGCGSGRSTTAASAPDAPRAAAAGGVFFPDGPPRRAVIWALGDGAPGPGASSVGRLVSHARADAVLYLGDVYPMGTGPAFRDGYGPAFGSFARRTAPTPGNHDWPVRGDGYDPYWRGVHGRTPPPWYSFSAGGWRLISLNSETSARGAELRWLKTRLRGSGDCRLAFWHRPRYSAGPHGDDLAMEPVWGALAGHARIVVSGHDHDMERLQPSRGITQYVAGAGGYSHYPLDRSDKRVLFGDDRSYGALRMTLTPGSAQLDFISAGGRVLDSSTIGCSR